MIAISDSSEQPRLGRPPEGDYRPRDPEPRGGGRDRTRRSATPSGSPSRPATSAMQRCCRGATTRDSGCSGRRFSCASAAATDAAGPEAVLGLAAAAAGLGWTSLPSGWTRIQRVLIDGGRARLRPAAVARTPRPARSSSRMTAWARPRGCVRRRDPRAVPRACARAPRRSDARASRRRTSRSGSAPRPRRGTARRVCSTPANAITSASRVERGRWKFVSSASTRRNSKPGSDEELVRPGERRRRERASPAPAPSSCRPPARAPPRGSAPTPRAVPRSARRAAGAPRRGRRVSGRNVSSPTCSVTRSTSSRASSSGVKWSPAVGAAAEPGGRRVDRLVPLGVAERLGDVRRQRRLARRLAVEPQAPPALAEMLEQLDRPVPLPRPQPPRRPREPLPLLARRAARAAAPRPVGRSIAIRAGTTRVSFTTASVPAGSSPGRSRNARWRISPSARE